MKKFLVLILSVFASLLLFAHAPLLDVNEGEQGYIIIQGGFSNGEDATGVLIYVLKDKNYNGTEEAYEGKMKIFEGNLEKGGELVLPKPKGKYIVVFDAGPGHVTEKKGPKLTDAEKDAWKKAIDSDTKLGKWKDKYIGNVK